MMATDLKADLLEEIALEGLDGITIKALWVRLEWRKGFSLKLDDQSKAYLWKCVMGLEDLEFYELKKPRPDLIPYNRFHYVDPETKHFLETEDIPDNIYPVNIITDQPIKGSCADFTTRRDITDQLLADRPSLANALERYGNKLVIVASQSDRLRALIGTENDPNFQTSDVSYCILERIGRARYSGEVAAGKNSLNLIVDNSKTLFYQMKKLRSLAVIRKQRMCTIRKPTNVKVTLCLFHLNRFFQPVFSKTHSEVVALAKLLSSKPEQMEIVSKAKQTLKVFEKSFKKVAQSASPSGDRYFEFIDIPWRELHPNATPKEYLLKNGRAEKTIRHIRLLKSVNEVESRTEAVESSDEEEEDVMDDNVPDLVFRRDFDMPYLYQVMELMRAAGSRGLSMTELKRVINTTRLGVRRVCNHLHRQHYLTTILRNKGRQKEVMYVAVEKFQDNKIHKSVTEESQKFGDFKVEEFKAAPHSKENKAADSPVVAGPDTRNTAEEDKVNLSVERLSEQKIHAIKEELDKLEEMGKQVTRGPSSQAKIEVIREMTEDGTYVKVKIEEKHMMGPEHNKPGSHCIGLKRFGKLITVVHIRRINWIVEVVSAVKVLESFRLLRLLRNREKELKMSFMMDQKSLNRLTVALVQEKRIRCYYVWITVGEKKKEFRYLCDSSVRQQDEELTRAIEQAKLRYFSVSKEELRKKSQMLAAAQAALQAPTKPAQSEGPGIPESAKASIQRHLEYRQKILSRSHGMKYDRRAGARYGLMPKMLRLQTAHQILWHLCYEIYGHKIVQDKNTARIYSVENTDTISEDVLSLEDMMADTGSVQHAKETGGTKRKKVGGSKRKEPVTTHEVDQGDTKRQKLEGSQSEIQNNDHEEKQHNVEENSAEPGVSSDKIDTSQIVDSITTEASEGSAMDEQDKPADKETIEKEETPKRKDGYMMEEDKIFSDEGLWQSGSNWPLREPHVYFEEMTWRRHIPPVPEHAGYSKGWCLMRDILLNLPVSVFCQLVNVSYDIKGLTEILSDTRKRLYPVMKLPFTISKQLLHSKKYVQSFFETCIYLCEMGLLTFGQEVLKDKDQTFIYLHRHARIVDTRESMRGYNKTKPPEGHVFPVKKYHFKALSDIHSYWEDLQIIALGSNLGYKSFVEKDLDDQVEFCVKSLPDAAKPNTPSTVVDNGEIPGDGRGAAGMDSALYVHASKSWTFASMSRTAICEKQYSKFKPPDNSNIVGERKIVNFHLKGKKRLCLSENTDKPVQMKTVVRDNVKGNKGGKGRKKTPALIQSQQDKKKKKRRNLLKLPKKPVKKKPSEKGDEKDKAIYAERKKQRVIWSAKEDSVLLMCWLACLLMDKNRKVSIVNYRVMRDYLHDKVGKVSHDKTSIACSRRLKFVLRNPQTEANLVLYYREGSQDPYIKKEYVERVFINTDTDVVPKFKALTDHLLDKFQSLNLKKSALPASLSEMDQYRVDSMSKLYKSKVYKDVTCKEEICHDVLRNILHSAVLLQDKQGRTHEMFKLLTQYPDQLLSGVIKELRTDGLFVIQKKNYTRASLGQLHSGLGLRNFKVSQRYMYNYKHRSLSTLFEDSAGFVDSLCTRYVDNEGDDQSITLDFQPKGGQSAILIPLILQNKLDIKLTLPQELVVVDMEGFYSFPWGRGKNVTPSTSKSDRSLQEMMKNKALIDKEKSKAAKTVAKKPAIDRYDLDDEEEEDVNIDKSVTKDTGSETKEVDVPDPEAGSSAVQMETDDTSDGKINTFEPGKEKSTSISTDSGKGFVLIGKTIEEIKRNLSAEGTRAGDGEEGKTLAYTCTRNGSSTFIVPTYEDTDTGDLPQGVIGFASRTLLSLRRAEDVSFEDIRVFNAQDNFVVNSCKIKVKLKNNEKETIKKRGEVVEVVSDNLNDVKPFDNTEGEKKDTFEEKKQFIEKLRVDKKKMKDLWEELQRLLPFQVDMEKVWEALKIEGKSEDEMAIYKQVYGTIDSEGVLGIRISDLQGHFQATLLLREIIGSLKKYAATAMLKQTTLQQDKG